MASVHDLMGSLIAMAAAVLSRAESAWEGARTNAHLGA
jgi:hypothetical protein